MKVFLTGSTGLLGNNIAHELVKQGHTVTALVRSPEKARKVVDSKIKLIEGSLQEIEKYADKLAGHDALIHSAAVYGEYYRNGEENILYEVNVKGTMTLLEEARKRGIQNMVYISSAGVLELNKKGPTDESAPFTTSGDAYFQSKVEAEKRVSAFQKQYPEIRIVTLLPSAMLGPGDQGPTPMGKAVIGIVGGFMKVVPPGGNCIVDARDVAKAAVAGIKKGKSGQRYVLGSPKYTFAELSSVAGEVTGRKTATKVIPPMLVMLRALLQTAAGKFTGKPAALKPSMVKKMQTNFQYSREKAEKELGITFRPFKQTVKDTSNWFINNGYV